MRILWLDAALSRAPVNDPTNDGAAPPAGGIHAVKMGL